MSPENCVLTSLDYIQDDIKTGRAVDPTTKIHKERSSKYKEWKFNVNFHSETWGGKNYKNGTEKDQLIRSETRSTY